MSSAKFCGFLFLCSLVFACQTNKEPINQTNNEFTVSAVSKDPTTDSLFIYDAATEELLAKVPVKSEQREFSFPIETPTIGVVKSRSDDWRSYALVILKPDGKTRLLVDSVSFVSSGNLADSLLNFIQDNTNEAFGTPKISRVIKQGRPEEVMQIFDSIKVARAGVLESLSDRLSEEELELLHFRSKAGIHSFLLYYGQWIRKYEPTNPFFAFLKEIDKESSWNKTLPGNLLFKYDIEFLTERDSIDDLESFLIFIEERTTNKDLASFLKAYYVRQVIQRPARWKKHEQLFNSVSIKKALEREKENPYADLIKSATDSYFTSQKGIKGYDFTAYDSDSLPVKLSDFKGKLVFIDVWATWCGPCIEHRPNVLKLAEKYKDNENIEILMISVDSSKKRWQKYIDKTNPEKWGNELMIQNGIGTEFGDKYLIKAIPKYMLIDNSGVIIDSDAPDPSIALETLIESELNKMVLATTL